MRMGFKQSVWLFVLLVCAYLLAAPSFMDLWASMRWNRTPCYMSEKDGILQFIFTVGDQQYVSHRRDFWQLTHAPADPAPPNILINNSECWVNPADPHDAVLYLDAHKNWADSLGRVTAAAFLIVCVGAMLHFGLKHKVPAARRERTSAKGSNEI